MAGAVKGLNSIIMMVARWEWRRDTESEDARPRASEGSWRALCGVGQNMGWLRAGSTLGAVAVGVNAPTPSFEARGCVASLLLCKHEHRAFDRGWHRLTCLGGAAPSVGPQDPNLRNLVAEVSIKKPVLYEQPKEEGVGPPPVLPFPPGGGSKHRSTGGKEAADLGSGLRDEVQHRPILHPLPQGESQGLPCNFTHRGHGQTSVDRPSPRGRPI